jgi:hypothetical protein
LFRRRIHFNAAVPPDPVHAQNFCQRLIERSRGLFPAERKLREKRPLPAEDGWTQMKNSYSVSALIGVICGQVWIRLRLAALWSLWQNDFAVSPVFHDLSGHP